MKKLIALLLAVIMVLSMAACGGEEGQDPTTGATPDTPTTENQLTNTEAPADPTGAATDPTGAATDPTAETQPFVPFVPEIGEGIYSKTSYTVADKELTDNGDVVVATVGDRELTLSQLQVYYWMNLYAFLNQYGYYLSYIGMDIAHPLDQQQCPETAGTWQQHFLSEALTSWHEYQALAIKGEEENIPVEDEFQKELDNLDSSLESSQTEGGYESIDAMLAHDIGPGVTKDSYRAYLSTYVTGFSYYNHLNNTIEVTDDMIDAYFAEHEEELAQNEITKEKGKTVDVRHILFQPEGGTTGEDGQTTYTDEEWAACEEKAQAVLDLWLAGDKSEDLFASLATEHTEDPGSKETGGLYEGVKTGQMVPEFDAWCFDESRKVGDYGLVKTSYGYHVMYFCGDELLWIGECRNGVLNEKLGNAVEAALEAYPLEVNYGNIMLGNRNLAG